MMMIGHFLSHHLNQLRRKEVFYSSVLKICKKQKKMKEKGIKSEDVKNIPPIEEIHGLDIPTQVVEVILFVDLMKVISLPISLLASV
jgi:hypothetical protein